uniref:Uncharacterized protein n=2 Tax=Avena sativa TaxID=4498 RepID=A0ACD5T7J3_AVESA
MKGISCACAITVLFIASLASVGHCRLQAMPSYQDGGANTTADATSMDSSPDESKVNLKFCTARDCKTKGEAWDFHCICCLVMPDVPCWHTVKECQENCRACNPNCTPSQPAQELHV